MDQLLALIVDESKWLPVAMGLALLIVAILLYRCRNSNLPRRRLVMATMNLFFGVMIGIMAFGHLLAVTVKLALGTLAGSLPLFYTIGVAFAVPSFWLVYHALKMVTSDNEHSKTTVVLNGWLALTLLVLGLPNLPLAIPGLLNIGYHFHARRAIGWVLVTIAVVLNVGLFIGALIFLASGQSFEQFSGME